MPASQRLAVRLIAGVLIGLLAGCTGSGTAGPPVPAAKTLTARMRAAVGSARSVHVAGRLVESGHRIGLDINVLRSGQLAGTIVQDGIPLEITVTGGKAYVKATPAFIRGLRLPAAVCHTICGRYVQLPVAKARNLAARLSMSRLTTPLTGPVPRFRDVGVATVGGKPAYVLRTSNGATVDVAQATPHYPLAVSAAGGNGRLSFSQWNKVRAPTAPPRSQIVSAGTLG